MQIGEIELIGVPGTTTGTTPTVTLSATDSSAAEGTPADPGRFTFVRSGDLAGNLTVNYAIGGSATGGDYAETLSGTVTILNQNASATIDITPTDDLQVEGNESLVLTLQGGAGYLIGTANSGTITIIDNDASSGANVVNYDSFQSSTGLQLNGDAVVTGGELRLVDAAVAQFGSAYYTTPIAVDGDTSFQTKFEARFDGGQGSAGGEGLAFVIQNSPDGTSAQNIGPYTGGLNYNGQPKSIGIELDTFKNGYEAYADEITITVNGVLVTPVATIASPFDLNNGQTYNVWVDYDGAADALSVFISNTSQKPLAPVVTANLKLDQIVGDQAYVGFAASTGTAFNNTYVESWNMSVTGAEPPGPNPGKFALAYDSYSAIENSGSVTVEVVRLGGSSGSASAIYGTFEEGTAVDGVDYDGVSLGTLVFADGQTSRTVTIDLTDDDDIEGTETFSFRLVSSEGADLLAPRTATINILDDDANLPVYPSFDSEIGLQLNGDAVVTGGELRLVAAAAQQRGSTYYVAPISVDSSTSFQSSFAARFDGGQGSGGGEGLAFVIQNSPAGPSAQNIGNYSGGLDYNAVPNSIGIELDTFKNPYEAYADELTVTVNGVLVTPVANIQSPFDLNNGQTYYVWVDYNGDSDKLAVYVSAENDKPDFAWLVVDIELDQVVGNQAYMGFASATGTAFNNTYIESWNVTLEPPNPDPKTYPSGDIVENNLITGLNQPLAVEWSPDGRNMYIAEKGGVLKVSRDGGPVTTVIDISNMVNEYQDRGLLDFALHPEFESNGLIYLLYTVDPPEVYDNVGNAFAGPDGKGNRAGQLMKVTADAATNFTTLDPDAPREIILGTNSTWDNFNAFTDSTLNLNEPQGGLNPDGSYMDDFVNSDSRSHTVGSLAFDLNGYLFVSIGDGASFNATDVRALRVQDVNSLSGKVLRIDPITGAGVSDNPFYVTGDPNANASKVYQLGLRNPWRLTFDPVTERLFIGETGLVSFEEINTGGPGTNFGWPFYEGGQGVNRRTPSYQNLAAAQAFYASGAVAKPGTIALAHGDGSDVIVLGAVTHDLPFGPQYEGDVFYNDMARGVVRHADIDANGDLISTQVFTTGAQYVVDIRQGPDNGLYYVNLVEGTVGKWEFV